jgi:ATP-binding cassette subfamily B protein
VPLPFIAWLIHQVRDRLRTGFEKIDRVWAEVTNVLADTIPGIRVVKAFAQEEREANRFRDANRHNLAVNDRLNRLWSLFSPTVTLLTEIGLLVVWAFGIWLVAQHQITVGVLTAFLAYIGRFYTRLDSMSRIVSVTQKAAPAPSASSTSWTTSPACPSRQPGASGPGAGAHRAGGWLSLRQPRTIRQLDLDIAPGEMIGLVGHSGSGKSTLVNLICRFYDVAEGRIPSTAWTSAGGGGRLPPPHRPGAAGALPVLRHHRREHRLRQARRHARRDRRRRARRARARVHPAPAAGLRLAGGRARPGPVGRRAPAHLHRARAADRPAHPDPGRGHSSVDTETEKEIQKALDNLVRAAPPSPSPTACPRCARPTAWW